MCSVNPRRPVVYEQFQELVQAKLGKGCLQRGWSSARLADGHLVRPRRSLLDQERRVKRSQFQDVFWTEESTTSFSGKVWPRKDMSPGLIPPLQAQGGWEGRETARPASHEHNPGQRCRGTDLSPGSGSWLRPSVGAMGGLAGRRWPCADGSGVGLAGLWSAGG